MCGIVGIFNVRDRGEIDRALLVRMNARQFHRGPDEGGEHVEPGLGLGHRRLSIIDLASGQQPMANEDGSVLTIFNGEIYNFQEVAAELLRLGHTFKTHSDTEVIVHGWEEWGEECLRRLNGMFAIALWDRKRETLFLARDRLGKKPLHYCLTTDGRLLFASELKSILCDPTVPRTIDPGALEDYLAFGYVPDPRTILKAVHKLQPGHSLTIRRGQPLPAQREYWDVSFETRAAASSREIQTELIERLREAVRCRLISEVPLGAFLSGGVDSSAIVAMMSGLSAEPVNTCSIRFDDPQFDESLYAQQLAEKFGTRHHVEGVKVDDFDLIEQLVDIYDEPFADSSAIPTYRVCQLARKRVTVALSGDGGDECFAGYRRYQLFANEEAVRRRIPAGLRRQLFGTLGRLYPKLDWAPRMFRAKTTFQELALDTVEGYFNGVAIVPDDLRLSLYSPAFLAELQGYRAIEVFQRHASRCNGIDSLSLVQYLDFKTYLPGDILTKVDRASMAHSLEVRVPLLDYTLVEWIAGLPANLKLHGQQSKYVFKRSLRPYVPASILDRKKMGFAVPIAKWFRGALRDRLRERVLGSALASGGVFNVAKLEQVVDQHQSGKRDFSALLWALLMLEGFQRRTVGCA